MLYISSNIDTNRAFPPSLFLSYAFYFSRFKEIAMFYWRREISLSFRLKNLEKQVDGHRVALGPLSFATLFTGRLRAILYIVTQRDKKKKRIQQLLSFALRSGRIHCSLRPNLLSPLGSKTVFFFFLRNWPLLSLFSPLLLQFPFPLRLFPPPRCFKGKFQRLPMPNS